MIFNGQTAFKRSLSVIALSRLKCFRMLMTAEERNHSELLYEAALSSILITSG